MKKVITLFFCFIFIFSSFAKQDHNHKFWEKVSPEENLKPQTIFAQFLKEDLIQKTDSFRLIKAQKDEQGIVHQKYQLYKNGFPIEDNFMSFISKKGSLIAYHGRIAKEKIEKPIINIIEDEALNIAFQTINAKEYAWQSEAFSNIVKKVTKGKVESLFPIPELMFHFNDEFRLVYKIELVVTQPQGNMILYIDAETGEVLHQYDATNHVTGNCNTIHHGTQEIEFDQNGSNYELTDGSRKMETYLFPNNQVSYSMASIPTDNNIFWLNLFGDQRAAIDIHWATQVTYDYLQSVQITSFDDSYFGADIFSYVNYGNSSITKNNAFWNGYVLTYGSGGGFTFPDPVVTLDVAAHEFGHALTQEYGGGLIYFGESGAINESISDMLAASVEKRVLQNPITYNGLNLDPWLISDLNGNGIRNMSNPNAFNHPDTYHGDHWKNTLSLFDNGGVHFNSGVGNFWFYLLSEGGTGTNDNGFNYQVLPIGYDQAMRAVLRSYGLMDQFSDYEDFRNATILGSQLANMSCSMIQQIINAWDAVGVGDPNEVCSILVSIENETTQFCEADTHTFVSIFPAALGYTNSWRLNGSTVTMPVTIPSQGTHLLELVATNDTSGQEFTDEIEIHSLVCNPIVSFKNNWFFGFQNGFNFSNGIAEKISYPYENFESITIYSHDGDLTFYLSADADFSTDYGALLMDGIHTKIDTLPPINTSSLQIGPCVPSPNPTPDGLHHYVNMIVNSSDDNALNPGYSSLYQFTVDIIDPQNPVLVNSSPIYGSFSDPTDNNGALNCREGVTVIPSCDPNIFWIVTSNNFKMYVFELNYNTLWTGYVSIEHTYTASDFGIPFLSFGTFKVSPNGEKIIHGKNLYHFDQATGVITYDPNVEFDITNAFGAISSNSQYFYTGDVQTTEIFQFDLLATDIVGSKTSIGFSPYADNPFNSNLYQDFCLGPDNRIYVSRTGESVGSSPDSGRPLKEIFISVINNPDVKEVNGSTLFNANAYYFEDGSVNSGRLNFPSFIQANLTVQDELTLTTGIANCDEVSFTTQQCKPYYSWKFGDGDSLMLSNDYAVNHTYNSAGTYVASLTSTANGIVETVYDTIVIEDFNAYPIDILAPDYICEPFTIISAPAGFDFYEWSILSGSAIIQDSSLQTTGMTWQTTGPIEIQLIVRDNNGCEGFVTKTVNLVNEGETGSFIPEQDPLEDIFGECEVLNMPLAPKASNGCAPEIEATTNASFPITASGTTVITWNYDDGNGNTYSQTQNIIINDNDAPIPDQDTLPNIEEICSVKYIDAPTATDNCDGQVLGTTNQSFPITTSGITVVTWTYTDSKGNATTQSQNVNITGIDNSITQSGNVLTAVANGPGYSYSWFDCKDINAVLPNSNSQSYTVTYTSAYAVEITYEEECKATSLCRDASVISNIGNVNNFEVVIYPNPVSEFLYVQTDKKVNLEIYNAIGKLMSKTNANKINMKTYSAGLYFVNIYNGDKLLKIEKVMNK